jgi:hypothetical protein
VGELLSGAEGQFRGQGMGTPGAVNRGPLSVEAALDGDLDAYLDRELFVRPGLTLEARADGAATAATGSMRTLLDMAEEESQWLKTLPAPSPSVDLPAEPEAPAVEIPEWMRMSPGAKVTKSFASMLGPVEPEQEAVSTDAAGLPTTPWSAPAPQATLLPGIAPPPPGVPMPAWTPQYAAPVAPYPQQPWAMPMPVQPEPKRIAGMKPGAFVGAAAVGALAAGLLVVAGLHFREHASGTQAATVAGVAQGMPTGAASAGMGAQAGNVLSGGAQAGVTGMPGGMQAGVAQAGAAGVPGGVHAGAAQAGVAGVPGGMQAGVAGANGQTQAGQPGVTGAVPSGHPGQPGTVTGTQQAAASVAGTVLSTAQTDVQGAANGLRAEPPGTALPGGPAAGGTTLASGQTETIALRMPSASKAPAKKVVAARPADTEAEAPANGEVDFTESESSGADEESVTAEAADAEEAETQQSELDEDFARELGFTEDAEPKAPTHAAPERTVYVPPAPDAKEHLTPDDVKAVVVANQPAITACIRQHAKGTPVEAGGRFLVRWSVLPSGGTTGVSMDTDTLKATPLAGCIEDVVRRWKFPVHQVRMEEPIRFPFVF